MTDSGGGKGVHDAGCWLDIRPLCSPEAQVPPAGTIMKNKSGPSTDLLSHRPSETRNSARHLHSRPQFEVVQCSAQIFWNQK